MEIDIGLEPQLKKGPAGRRKFESRGVGRAGQTDAQKEGRKAGNCAKCLGEIDDGKCLTSPIYAGRSWELTWDEHLPLSVMRLGR